MVKNPLQFDRMRLVPKPKPVPRVVTPPKREVISRDIIKPVIRPDFSIKESSNELNNSLINFRDTENNKSVTKLKYGKILTADQATVWQPIKDKKEPFAWRSLAGLTLALFVFVCVFQAFAYVDNAQITSGQVLGDATSAYEDLNEANESLGLQDFTTARNKFSDAQSNLAAAQETLDKFRLLSLVAPPARSADNILTGAYFLAEAGKNLTTAMQLFDELSVTSDGIGTVNFTEKLQQNHNLLKNSLLFLSYAEEKFNDVSGLPADYNETLKTAQEQIKTLNSVLSDLVDLEDLFLSFFGSEPKTYLIVFQNYDEIRATGGFIGTYGVLNYQNGKINKLKIESIYNIDGSLTKQIAAPGPFQPDIKKWALRDSNWFVDFPTSAQKMLEFFEMESETADGVIALTPEIFIDILKMIGPIEMTEYGVTLDSDNFQEIVQDQTSINYDRKLNQPKKFLDDFAPIMLDRLSNLGKEQWFEMFQIMKNNFSERQMMVYSTDSETQEKIHKLGFDGSIKEAEHDYLSVFNSNLGGTKTDLDIKQSIFFTSEIKDSGEIENTVRIIRSNSSIDANKNYARILVPYGSNIINSTGFSDIVQLSSESEGYESDTNLRSWDNSVRIGNVYVRTEANKTEFSGWIETAGKSTSEITIKYTIPGKINTNFFNRNQGHSLLFQKQPGNLETYFEGEWILNNNNVVWQSPNTEFSNQTVKFNALTTTDQYWGLVLK